MGKSAFLLIFLVLISCCFVSATSTDIWSATVQENDASASENTGLDGYTQRFLINESYINDSADTIQLRFIGSDNEGINFDKVSICEVDPSSAGSCLAGTFGNITFDNGNRSSSTCIKLAGKSSDEILYTIDSSKAYYVSWHPVNSACDNIMQWSGSNVGKNYYASGDHVDDTGGFSFNADRTMSIEIIYKIDSPSTGPTITDTATSPSTVYTNTDFKFNMTATDPNNATLTGYVQFYINSSASGSQVSQSINNDTNTLIGTLANANFNKGATLIAEYWAGDGEENTTKANHSTITVNNSLPTQPTLTNPDNNSYVNSVSMNWSASTDADSDVIYYYVIANGTQVCYTTSLYCTNITTDGYYIWNVTPYDGENNGTVSLSRYFTYDGTAPSYSNLGKNSSSIKINDVVKFYAQWSDALIGLNHSIFSWNDTGLWHNDSSQTLISWSNTTKTVTSPKDTTIGWIIYANDSLNNWNDTGIQTFEVINTGPSQPVLNNPTDGAINQLLNVTLNVTVTDIDNDLMNVSFYQYGGSGGNSTIIITEPNEIEETGSYTSNKNITLSPSRIITNHINALKEGVATGSNCKIRWIYEDDTYSENETTVTSTVYANFTYTNPNQTRLVKEIQVWLEAAGGSNGVSVKDDEIWGYNNSLLNISENIINGSDATFIWYGLDYNTTYSWFSVIDDGVNTTTSPIWNFTTFAFPLSITTGPYPENNTGFNALPINFNLTMLALEDFNCTLMINNTENATGDYGAGADVSVSFDESLDDGYHEYYIICEDKVHNTLLNSTINTIFVDTQNPIITLNPNNAFTATNTSTIDNYQSIEFPLNITFTDERDLFAMEINITNSTGHTVFNRTNTSLSGLTYTYTETVNNSNWTSGIYNIEVIVSDSHTSTLIGDYKPTKLTDKLIFDTEENNKITIEADDAISSDTTQKYDRYLFEFEYPKTKTTDLIYHVKSDNKIYYRPDSSYKAHFIIWNPSTKKGNWIDFEDITLKDYTVQKITDNHYTITFKMPAEGIDTVKFNSIGGLNIVTENYEWFRGSTTQTYTDPVLTNISSTFYLNVTNTSTISDIDARFFYNFTEYNVTETTSDNYNFMATITTPVVEIGSQTFYFTWNVTVTQTDATHYNFSESNNQTISTANINITIRDEINQSIITEELDIYVINEGRYYTTNTGTLLIGNLSAGIPYIEIENENYPRRGYYITITENLTTYLTAYLLRSTDSTQEVIFTIQSSDLDKIEDAKMSFYRMVNMSYVSVGQVETDYAGQAALTLDTTNEYRIVIEADDYPIKTLNLRPLQTTYTITLQATGAGFENVFEGIAYTITPTNRSTNVSQNYTDFRLDIYSSNSDLELFGVRVFDHDYTCIPASCEQNITGSAAGGSAIVRVKGNTTGTVKIDVYYKRVDYALTYLNFNIYSFIESLKAHASSLWESMQEVKDENSPIMLAIISVIGTIALLGTAAEIGIYGLPLIVITAFGLIFFAMVGFIHPLIVGLSLILGGIVYFRFSGGAD